MPDNAQASNQRMIVIALVVIAVLLAAIVGVLIYQQSQAVPAPSSTAATTTDQSAQAGAAAQTGQVPTGMQAQAAAPGPFDPKTATKVPTGMTPQDLVKTYNEDVVKGDYADAYKLLPIDKQKSYGDVNSYGQQLKSYGITSYKIGTAQTSGDSISIPAEQVTPQMPITYTWTFKKVGDQWFVASRTMGGNVQ